MSYGGWRSRLCSARQTMALKIYFAIDEMPPKESDDLHIERVTRTRAENSRNREVSLEVFNSCDEK